MSMNYGYYNPYYPQPIQVQQPVTQPHQANTQTQQTQQNVQVFPAMYVSSKNEVESIRPDQNNNPMYFHNRGLKEIYLKQYDDTGAAPIKTFRLVDEEEQKAEQNIYETGFNLLNSKIDGILTLLQQGANVVNDDKQAVTPNAKGSKK